MVFEIINIQWCFNSHRIFVKTYNFIRGVKVFDLMNSKELVVTSLLIHVMKDERFLI